ncbi:MAG: hypothetical protein ABFD64_06035 [Armatimonadota bacterium]
MRTVMLFCLSVLSLASSIPASAEPLKSNSISIINLLEKARAASKIELWASDSVAEDKLSVYVDPSYAGKVEQGLDLLPGYQWISIKPADGTAYKVLGPDYIERSKWRNLADAADEEDQKRVRQYAAKQLAEYRAALALSKDGLQSLAAKDPKIVYDLTTPCFRVAVELIVSLNNEQMNQVLSPQGLRMNVRDLPAAMQENLLDNIIRGMIYRSANKHKKRDGTSAPSAKELEEVLINTGTLQLTGYDMGGFSVTIKSNDPLSDYCLFYVMGSKYSNYHPSRLSLLRAKSISTEAIKDLQEKEDYLFDILMDIKEKEKETRLTENPPRFGLRNAPDVKVSGLKPQDMCIKIIQDICKQKEYSFIAFEPGPRGETIADNTQLGFALDQVADNLCDYVWAYQDGQIIFIPRHFTYKLAENIPLPTINKLRAIAAQTGGIFDLDGLAEVVSLLNWRQLNALPENIPTDLAITSLAGKGIVATGIYYAKLNSALIKLYASLSPHRRKSACNGGVSFTVLGSKQKDLFYEALGSVATAVDLLPEPSYFSIDDRGSQNGNYHFITFTFGFVDGTTLPFDLQLPVPGVNNKTAQSAPKAVDNPASTQPQVLTVMKSLAEWNYSGRREHDDDNVTKAIMYSQIGDKLVKRILKVGETLEGAKLVEIGEKSAIFTLDGAQITFPITQATSLAPFDPKAPSIYTAWMGVDKIWEEALEKELSN